MSSILEDIGHEVAKYAPLIGAALPIPGGEAIGAIVAAKFGAKPGDPADLLAKIQTDPQAAIKLKEIEANHDVALQQVLMQRAVGLAQADAAMVGSVNTTMQAETKSEHWMQWAWRPTCGFALAFGFLALIVLIGWICIESVITQQPQLLSMIPPILEAFTVLFGSMAAVVGVTAWHRGVMQRNQAAGSSVTDDLVSAVAGKLNLGSLVGKP